MGYGVITDTDRNEAWHIIDTVVLVWEMGPNTRDEE